MNDTWRGGDVRVTTGGGFKINLLKQGIAKYKDDEDLVIFFTDRSEFNFYLTSVYLALS